MMRDVVLAVALLPLEDFDTVVGGPRTYNLRQVSGGCSSNSGIGGSQCSLVVCLRRTVYCLSLPSSNPYSGGGQGQAATTADVIAELEGEGRDDKPTVKAPLARRGSVLGLMAGKGKGQPAPVVVESVGQATIRYLLKESGATYSCREEGVRGQLPHSINHPANTFSITLLCLL